MFRFLLCTSLVLALAAASNAQYPVFLGTGDYYVPDAAWGVGYGQGYHTGSVCGPGGCAPCAGSSDGPNTRVVNRVFIPGYGFFNVRDDAHWRIIEKNIMKREAERVAKGGKPLTDPRRTSASR